LDQGEKSCFGCGVTDSGWELVIFSNSLFQQQLGFNGKVLRCEISWHYAPLSLLLHSSIFGNSIRTYFYDKGWHVLSRPAILRLDSPLRLFLERDSQSEQFGIQTFPGVTYIQVAVHSSKRIEDCRAWITRVDFNPDRTVFSLEHNERLPRHWSKHSLGDNLVVEIDPAHPPIRFNVGIFNEHGFELDGGTPTNLLPLLQRVGVHRFEVGVSGIVNGNTTSTKALLSVHWRGAGNGAVVSLQPI
jgi:hypothetical protein